MILVDYEQWLFNFLKDSKRIVGGCLITVYSQISQIHQSTKGCVDGFGAYYSITNEYVNISQDQSCLLAILFNLENISRQFK